MQLYWIIAFLLLCQTIQESECKIFEYQSTPEDPVLIINETEKYARPVDFRCYRSKLPEDFDFRNQFLYLGYALVLDDYGYGTPNRCTNKAKHYYPMLKGTDPLMPYYINTLYKGIYLAAKTSLFFMSASTPLRRSKEYCAMMRLKMMEFAKFCYVFRQTREMFAASLYDKLCLDEDGCYDVMKYYEDDLPYCVKYAAIREFKNSSIGSWHHTVINYCKLTAMVPEITETKYDISILRQLGRTKENLKDMCLYLRYRLLPEEGKEQEIPDTSDFEYETFDTETTPIYEKSISVFLATAGRAMIFVLLSHLLNLIEVVEHVK